MIKLQFYETPENRGASFKRTFQALRIELNSELSVLNSSIDSMIDRLNPEGRIAIITFHSLEDRIVNRHSGMQRIHVYAHPHFQSACVAGNQRAG